MSRCKYHVICPHFSNYGVCRAAPRNRALRCDLYQTYEENGSLYEELFRLYGSGERRPATVEEVKKVIEKNE